MVKQFTIPCQFQQSTSPVTLYIGHPEFTHHPVHFQSEWLSSTKGGTIPQDLMDTLQRLHDLANQNGADFEELCYYALISATQHSVGTGVSKEDINKYAQEYVQSDGQVAQQITETNKETNNDANDNDTTEQSKATEGQTERKTNKTESTKQEPQAQNEEQPYKKIAPSIQQPTKEDTKNKPEEKQAINDEDSLIGNTQIPSAQETQHNQDVLEQLGKIDDNKNNTNNANNNNIGTINMSSTPATTASAKSTAGEAVYTQEDEDLLLEDDMTTMQDEERAKEVEKMITNTMNEILAKQEKREAEEKAKSDANNTSTMDTETNAITENPDASDAKDNTADNIANNTNPFAESNATSSIYSSDDGDLFE